jgi:hypothetical protein
MKLRYACVLTLAAAFAARSASADYCINKDLINLGPPAYDIAVLITGNQPVSFLYSGWPGETFTSFTITPTGPDELLHWQNLNAVNDPIPTGSGSGPAQLHIGWCTVNPNNILNMYWTDLLGAQIPGSIVDQVGGHASMNSTPGVQWDNASNHPLTVSHVYYARFATRWDLGQLNRNNRTLAAALQAVPGGTAVTIAAGKSAQLKLPNVKSKDWVVIVHDVSSSVSRGAVTDFVQYQQP